MPRPCVVACLAVSGPDSLPPDAAERVAPADLVEVRLDGVAGGPAEAASLCREAARWGRPLLLTPRSRGEGGYRDWGEGERERFLEVAWDAAGARYMDIELRDSPDLLRWALANRPEGCEVVASYHAFQAYPGEEMLDALAREAEASGAHHFKAAVRVAHPGEAAGLACWTRSRSAGQSLITMALGDEGALSRLMNPAFGSWACYGSIDRATAPGQLEVGELAKLVRRFYPDGKPPAG